MNLAQLIGIRLMEDPQEPVQPAFSSIGRSAEEANTTRKHYADLGRAGGVKGGPARALSLTPERRSEIARMGAFARKEKLKSQV